MEKNCVCVQSKPEGAEVKKGTTVDITLSLGPEPTYSYYSDPVTIDNPFDFETDPAATFKFVLNQDGKTTTIKEVTLSYSDFPYTLTKVKGTSAGTGSIIVYMNGENIDELYDIAFKKVKD